MNTRTQISRQLEIKYRWESVRYRVRNWWKVNGDDVVDVITRTPLLICIAWVLWTTY